MYLSGVMELDILIGIVLKLAGSLRLKAYSANVTTMKINVHCPIDHHVFGQRSSLLFAIFIALLLFVALSAVAQLPTAFTANTVFVDGTYGNNATGLRERSDFPFQTIAAGIAAASAGDTIEIRPNTSYPTISSAIVINKANLTIRGYGVTFKAAAETTGTILRTTADSTAIEGITFDGGRTTSTSIQNWGTLEVQGTNCKIRRCKFQHSIGRLIRGSGNIDGWEISNCEISDFYQGIATDNITGSSGTNQRFEIPNNKIHDVWATTGFPGGIKLSNTGSPILKGVIQGNQLWGGTNSGNEVGIELQGNFQHVVTSGNRVNNYVFGISYDGVSHSQIDDNNIQQGGFCGIEFVGAAANDSATGNHLDGLSDSGAVAAGAGYSISTNVGVGTPAWIAITGGTVSGYSLAAVHSDRTSGITIRSLLVDMPIGGGGPFSFQHLGDSNTPAYISLENCTANIRTTNVYGVFAEISPGNVTSPEWYFRNLTFNYIGVASNYALFHFYSGDSSGTFNDVLISGTRTNGTFWGSGVIDSTGPTVSGVIFDNAPQSSPSSGSQFGFVDQLVSQTIDIGSHSSTSTASPNYIDLGGTYSNAGGQNAKVRLYNDGSGGVYGLGVSAGRMDLMVPTGASYNFYVNGALKFGLIGDNSTGAGNASLGSNSPAVTNTAPYTWIKIRTADGSTAYIPAWK